MKEMKKMELKLSLKELVGGGYYDYWHDKHFYRVVKGSRASKKSKTTALNFIYRIMKYSWANLLLFGVFQIPTVNQHMKIWCGRFQGFMLNIYSN